MQLAAKSGPPKLFARKMSLASNPEAFDVFDKSRRAAAGRAELLANFFGGAVWGNFRENANCGEPPG